MKKTAYAFLVLFFVTLTGVPALHAETDDSETARQAQEAYSDPSAFDGGSGSTLNENSGQDSGSSVPDVSPSGPVGVEEVYGQDDTGGSDPSAFEGDTDSMPGERAPENLPMDDAPVDAGIGVQ